MNKMIMPLLICGIATAWGQTNTEVYLFDIKKVDGKTEIVNPRNISNNEGYDNQPSFYDENTILFSSTRKGQTDIAKYDIKSGKRIWVTDTPQGSEYSPIKIPGKNSASSIRVDTPSLQRLYEYSIWDGTYTELLKDLKTAYHVWYDRNIVVSSILLDDSMDLVISNLTDGTHRTVQNSVGRSLHKIPDSNLISFISKENEEWEIRSLNPHSGEVKKIAKMFENIDDICWLAADVIIAANNKTLMQINPETKNGWGRFLRLERKGINNISRIAVSPNGKYLSLVVEQLPAGVVQNQLDAYNARDIEAFLNTYSDDVQLFSFPNELNYTGKEKMRENYTNFFGSTPDLKCEIKNRIVIGNKVIDKEIVTANGNTFSAVAIYEVENGKIAKVTFIR